MLARVNRVVDADDFRFAVRRGRRFSTPHAVVYVARRDVSSPTRFGFIVSKAVGNAVVRNTVTRRLRAVGHSLLPAHPTGTDIVVRALPGSNEVSWATLQDEISDGLDRSANRQ